VSGSPVVGAYVYVYREGSDMIAAMRVQTMVADATGYGHMDGFGWGMIGMGWLMILIVGGLVVWAVVYTSSRSSSPSESSQVSAERILADRFARGEIDTDEYRDRLEELRR
jgi:putative membrane protein